MGSDARALAGIASCVALLVVGVAPAAAETYKPTRKDDPVPGKCKPDDCSLREATMAANLTQQEDTILLGKGTYEMEQPPTVGGGAENGDWWTYGSTVRGKGPGKTTLDANGLDRVMQLGNFTEKTNRLEGVRITGGAGQAPGSPGGIIGVGGHMTLKDVTISGNTGMNAAGGARMEPRISLTIVDSRVHDNGVSGTSFGGGLSIFPGSAAEEIKAKVKRSQITENDAYFGGGIYSRVQVLKISQSTIAGNDATEGGGLDLVANPEFQPVTTIDSTTISGNTAGKGGGVLVDGNQPTIGYEKPVVEMKNSTIAENFARAEGGGIMADNQASVTFDNVTVAHNMADSDNTGGGVAGGIYQHSGATFAVGDSVVGANTVGTSGDGSQCGGDFVGDPAFVIQSGPGSGTCNFVPGIATAADLRLGALTDNGGLTQTVGLRSQAPALGRSDDCPKKDQRGRPRPEEDCDSGAFERP